MEHYGHIRHPATGEVIATVKDGKIIGKHGCSLADNVNSDTAGFVNSERRANCGMNCVEAGRPASAAFFALRSDLTDLEPQHFSGGGRPGWLPS